MKRTIKRAVRPLRAAVTKLVLLPPPPPTHWPSSLTLLEKTAFLAASDKIEGDYLEFGVFQGKTVIEAYHSFRRTFEQRISEVGFNGTSGDATQRQRIWDQMRFFAFDSFEGLPEPQGIDADTRDFSGGQYAAGVEEVRQNLLRAGVPADRVVFVPGWFDVTCMPATAEEHGIRKAAAIWIDCDLYHSTTKVLEFVTPLLQDGTVIVFDDWYSFRGNPRRGEQRAFSEWKETVEGVPASRGRTARRVRVVDRPGYR
jgi:O-methyltransferase